MTFLKTATSVNLWLVIWECCVSALAVCLEDGVSDKDGDVDKCLDG